MSRVEKLAFDQQAAILRRCIARKLPLDMELERLGYCYEDLRYRINAKPLPYNGVVEVLGDHHHRSHLVPCVSFFSGAGGLDLGFEAAGFDHLAAFERHAIYCETLRRNRPWWRVIGPPLSEGDMRKRDSVASILLDDVRIHAPFEGVFHGGPPCQSFSVAANQRFCKSGDRFKRTGFGHQEFGTLLFDYVWCIRVFRPRAFVIENVPGITTVDGGEQLSTALELLESSGFTISGPTCFNVANYGVPQQRVRLLIVGWRGTGKLHWPTPCAPGARCHEALSVPMNGAKNHITRSHKAKSIVRYMELDYGKRDHLGRVDRLDPTRPAKTVIAGGDRGGGRSHLHPDVPRTLSPRECARLQTFPDDYEFCGTHGRQFTQVGNAVPPLFAMKLARAIYDSLFK